MTTVIRRKRTSRLSIGPYRRHELLTGRIQYPAQGYTGYGDGVGTDLTAFISDQMRADWEANRAVMAFWRSGNVEADVFPDTLPWLYEGGSAAAPPWAARHLERGLAPLCQFWRQNPNYWRSTTRFECCATISTSLDTVQGPNPNPARPFG